LGKMWTNLGKFWGVWVKFGKLGKIGKSWVKFN